MFLEEGRTVFSPVEQVLMFHLPHFWEKVFLKWRLHWYAKIIREHLFSFIWSQISYLLCFSRPRNFSKLYWYNNVFLESTLTWTRKIWADTEDTTLCWKTFVLWRCTGNKLVSVSPINDSVVSWNKTRPLSKESREKNLRLCCDVRAIRLFKKWLFPLKKKKKIIYPVIND